MKINIVAVGKIKEKYLVDGIKEYSKRLSRFCELNIIEVSDIDNEKALRIEGKSILDRLSKNSYNIGLVIKGNELSSIELADKIIDITNYHNSSINFIIGGSVGLDESVLDILDYRLSFSKLTFPHQLMRLILLEQVYRSFKIINKETYHK